MLARYSHPQVDDLWSDTSTFQSWLEIERQVLIAQRAHGVVAWDGTTPLLDWLDNLKIGAVEAAAVRMAERQTQHDVAAFLAMVRSKAPQGQWLHFGLTSSDVVDTAQGMRFYELHRTLLVELGHLISAITRWTLEDTPVLGRTHGQPAEPTSMRVRALGWLAQIEPTITNLSLHTRRMQVAKLSGPVGTYAHNPGKIEVDVAIALHLRPAGPGSTQIVPRSDLALWASAAGAFAAACSKIAMDVRLMNLTGEVNWPPAEKQIGSSAMPHKCNPIVAEQIGGLNRMAQGYAAMLQSQDIWLERDISHSSVERVAVPDLWHVLLRISMQTRAMLESMLLLSSGVAKNLGDAEPGIFSAYRMLDAIRYGMNYDEARKRGRWDIQSGVNTPPLEWFTRNYPKGK